MKTAVYETTITTFGKRGARQVRKAWMAEAHGQDSGWILECTSEVEANQALAEYLAGQVAA